MPETKKWRWLLVGFFVGTVASTSILLGMTRTSWSKRGLALGWTWLGTDGQEPPQDSETEEAHGSHAHDHASPHTHSHDHATGTGHDDTHVHEPGESSIALTAQAIANLRLVAKPLEATRYWKTLTVPGMIVDRPGVSDRSVTAPATAVVTHIHRFSGDVVAPGEPMFRLRLVGESFQTSQTELYKAMKDREILRENIERLNVPSSTGAIARNEFASLNNEIRRLEVRIDAYRQDLQIRGLTPPQIEQIAGGTLISEFEVVAPPFVHSQVVEPNGRHEASEIFYEVQSLAVELGRQVTAGTELCKLSNHESLFVEGHAYRQDLASLQQATATGSPVRLETMTQSGDLWEQPIPLLTIHHVANTLASHQPFLPFYLELHNQSKLYHRDGKARRLWRFRPGQRVRLHLDVEPLENVFVLPVSAVLREGGEAFVFEQVDMHFHRRPVQVVYRTDDIVVVPNDGSITPGCLIAQGSARQLHRMMQRQRGDDGPTGHVHADGTVHEH